MITLFPSGDNSDTRINDGDVPSILSLRPLRASVSDLHEHDPLSEYLVDLVRMLVRRSAVSSKREDGSTALLSGDIQVSDICIISPNIFNPIGRNCRAA